MPVTSATGNSGFTLLEMMVVLAIIVLMAAAWPIAATHVIPGQRLRAEANKMLATAALARVSARNSGRALDWTMVEENETAPAGIVTRLPLGMRAQLIDPQSPRKNRVVHFYPDGSSSGAVIELLLGDKHLTVRVHAITGRAEIDT